MTVTVLLSTTGAGTWIPPPDCPAGTLVHEEAWGAGAGAGGTTTNGSGGAAGCFVSTDYTIQPSDITSGIACNVGAGSAGTGASNPTAGGDTTFGTAPKNLIPNSINFGAVVGGALPTGWTTTVSGTMVVSVVAIGFDVTTGLNYIDLSFVGTPTTAYGVSVGSSFPGTASVSYTGSAYLALISGSFTNITGLFFQTTWESATGGFLTNVNMWSVVTLTGSLVRHSAAATSNASTVEIGAPFLVFTWTSGAVNATIRFAGIQLEQAAAVTTYQPTPTSYLLAKGGAGPVTTTGGVSPHAGNSFGIVGFKGGNGAAFNASGSGGGGAAGKAGVGAVGTTAGVGGTADAGSGGAGGARATVSPGNPGTANVEGGGGGGALITATSGVGGAGAIPGGGGGGAETTGSTGGAGARGQIRLTYTPFIYQPIPLLHQLQPILAQ